MPVFHKTVLFCFVAVATSAVTAQQSARPASDSRLEQHVIAARNAQAHADCHLAAAEYRAASRLLPSSGELRTNEGIALYCDHQLPSAISTFNAALVLNRGLTVPHLFLGLAAYRLGNSPTAARELSLYLQSMPNDAVAHLWLGYTLAAQNDSAAARDQFQDVLARDPHNPDALYALGEAELALAHADALRIQQLDPTGAHLLHLAATRYHLLGDSTRFKAASDQSALLLATSGPVPPDRAKELATLDADAQQHQSDALAAFAAILESVPNSFRAHQVLGDAFVVAQQQPAAVEEYESVVRLNPDLPGVHETLSQCLMTVGRFADALAALNAELALSPTASPRLETRIGQVKLAMGDTAGASASLEHAIATSAAPPEASLLLAEARLRQSRPAEAIPLLKSYIAADPTSGTAFFYLSRAYRATGDRAAMAQALAEYKRVGEDAQQRALADSVTRSTGVNSFVSVAPAPELSANSAGDAPK